MTRKTILVVAAHPDDEVLGCGGTMARWSMQGHRVIVAFMADGVGARDRSGAVEEEALRRRRDAASQACRILGADTHTFGDMPDNRLDTLPLLDIVQAVEQLIHVYSPGTVLTHHAGDVNIDHQRIHQAVVTACRPLPGHPVKRLLFFEVASSTEWQPPGSAPAFTPQVFVDIGTTLEHKMAALKAYVEEMRSWPHARSYRACEHHARWRGASVGMEAAEAFMLGRDLA